MLLSPLLKTCCVLSLAVSAPAIASVNDYCATRYSDVFSLAVCREDLNKVRVMVEVQGHDLKTADADGQTPLSVAFHSGSVYWEPIDPGMAPMIKYLLAHGADPNQRSPDRQRPPLFEAAYTGNMELVPLLVEAGADVNARDSDGLTPAHEAAFCDFRLNCDDCSASAGSWRAGAKPVLQYLASKGADLHAKSSDGRSVLAVVPAPGCSADDTKCDVAKLPTSSWSGGYCRETYLYVRSVVGDQK